MLFEIILILIVTRSRKCSLVLDSQSQKGIYVSDFCPSSKYCPEGSHVMCMYYSSLSKMGPRCRNPVDIPMTPSIATRLIDLSNEVRSRLAKGNETGKGGILLPRAYGMFRLKWDAELATFAQVLANQCICRHDLCRASNKFANPGQVIGLIRFSVPDWLPVSRDGRTTITTPGLNHQKITYAVQQTIKSWYDHKRHVTQQMLMSYPDWSLDPNNRNGRLYLEMIYGPSTHIGCGISGYTNYAFYDDNSTLQFNSIEIVCNFSARAHKNRAVYNTVPPMDVETSFNACGCPAGSIEDDDCLCHEIHPEGQGEQDRCSNGANCDPTVVLLPIFTVEDAPPEKLVGPNRYTNTSNVKRTGRPPQDSFKELVGNRLLVNRKSHRNKIRTQGNEFNDNQNERPTSHIRVAIKERHYGVKENAQENHERIGGKRRQPRKRMQHKQSLFAKTPRFELSGSHFLPTIKKDVVSRKDFTKGKKLVGKYLFGRRDIILPSQTHSNADVHQPKSLEMGNINHNSYSDIDTHLIHQKTNAYNEDVHFNEILTTETVLNTAEQQVINHKNHIEDLNVTQSFYKQDFVEDRDNKLMALLDTLEQEVKHVEMRDRVRELFDAKIKKIYSKILKGKSFDVVTTMNKVEVAGTSAEYKDHIRENIDHDLGTNEYEHFDHDFDDVRILEPPHDEVKHNVIEHGFKGQTESENDKYETQPKLDFEETVRPILKSLKRSKYDNKGKNYLPRSKITLKQRNQNHIDLLEYYKHDNTYTNRNTYKNVSKRSKNGIDMLNPGGKALGHNLKNNNYQENRNDDVLSAERRKYYQDKLDEMEKKLRDVERYSNKNTANRGRHMRAMRPASRSENQMDPYTQGRARFIHAY